MIARARGGPTPARAPSSSYRVAQWRRRLAACRASSSSPSATAADEEGAASTPPPPPPPQQQQRRRRTTRVPFHSDADENDSSNNNNTTTPILAAASAAEAAQRRHRAALERRLGRAGLGLPAATVQRVARRSAAPRGGVPSDPSVVAARAVALHRLLGPALAARVLYTHPTILGRDEAALARNLSAWRATLAELDGRAEAARARMRDGGEEESGQQAGGGDDGDGNDEDAAASEPLEASEGREGSGPSRPASPSSSSAGATAMLRRLTKVPGLLALRPERAVPHLFETAVLLGVPPREWDAWAAGRAPYLASLRPDTVAAKLAAAHAALNWRPDPLESPQSAEAAAAGAGEAAAAAGAAFSWLGAEYNDEEEGDQEERVTMDQVRAAARRDHRWLLYASAEVRRRIAALARALDSGDDGGDGGGEEDEEEEDGGRGGRRRASSSSSPSPPSSPAPTSPAARRAAASMFLRQPSLVCKPPRLVGRRLRAFAALPGIRGDEEEGEEDVGGGGGDGGGSALRPSLSRPLRALESMPALLNLQPEALSARWRRLRALAARRERWRDELGRMAPSTLAGVLALSERRVEARAEQLLPVLEAVEAAEEAEEERAEEEEDEDGGGGGVGASTPLPPRRRRRKSGEDDPGRRLPPPPPALRSLAYELKCTDRAFAARRGSAAALAAAKAKGK